MGQGSVPQASFLVIRIVRHAGNSGGSRTEGVSVYENINIETKKKKKGLSNFEVTSPKYWLVNTQHPLNPPT